MRSYISPKVKIGKSRIGEGLFAVSDISMGELIVNYSTGPGKFLIAEETNELYEKGYDYLIQVDDDLFFAATNDEELEDADFINHSCDPNCGINGSLKIVAMKDIKQGEEITIDYAMCESSNYSIICKCGSSICRKIITGDDWKKKELQEKYNGYFSDYIKKKIEAHKN